MLSSPCRKLRFLYKLIFYLQTLLPLIYLWFVFLGYLGSFRLVISLEWLSITTLSTVILPPYLVVLFSLSCINMILCMYVFVFCLPPLEYLLPGGKKEFCLLCSSTLRALPGISRSSESPVDSVKNVLQKEDIFCCSNLPSPFLRYKMWNTQYTFVISLSSKTKTTKHTQSVLFSPLF